MKAQAKREKDTPKGSGKAKKQQRATVPPSPVKPAVEPVPGWEACGEEIQARLRQGEKDGHFILPTRGPSKPVIRVRIEGFSLADDIIGMRAEEE